MSRSIGMWRRWVPAAWLCLCVAGPAAAQVQPLDAAEQANRQAASEVARAASPVQAAASAIAQARAAAGSADKAASEAGVKTGKASTVQSLLTAVDQLSGRVYGFLGVLLAVSTLSMALTEIVKALGDLRRHFHAWRLKRWLGQEHAKVMPELLNLAIGDEHHAQVLCGQELAKMMGQIQASARVALDYPEQYPALYAFLSRSGLPNDRDATLWQAQAQLLAVKSPPADVDAAQAAQARARLANLVSRKLDAFQLRTEYWWARNCQALAMVISVLVMWQVLGVAMPDAPYALRLVAGVLGGLAAPFMRDLSSSIAALKPTARK